jgi:hypothetical protein
MKKILVITLAIAILLAVGIAGFNSSKGASKNTEGISEMPATPNATGVASNGK